MTVIRMLLNQVDSNIEKREEAGKDMTQTKLQLKVLSDSMKPGSENVPQNDISRA